VKSWFEKETGRHGHLPKRRHGRRQPRDTCTYSECGTWLGTATPFIANFARLFDLLRGLLLRLGLVEPSRPSFSSHTGDSGVHIHIPTNCSSARSPDSSKGVLHAAGPGAVPATTLSMKPSEICEPR
jgi:hypothetical protein